MWRKLMLTAILKRKFLICFRGFSVNSLFIGVFLFWGERLLIRGWHYYMPTTVHTRVGICGPKICWSMGTSVTTFLWATKCWLCSSVSNHQPSIERHGSSAPNGLYAPGKHHHNAKNDWHGGMVASEFWILNQKFVHVAVQIRLWTQR